MADSQDVNLNCGGIGCLALVVICWLIFGGGFVLIDLVLRHMAGVS